MCGGGGGVVWCGAVRCGAVRCGGGGGGVVWCGAVRWWWWCGVVCVYDPVTGPTTGTAKGFTEIAESVKNSLNDKTCYHYTLTVLSELITSVVGGGLGLLL